MSFGRVVFEARMKAGLKQDELALQIKKEDGTPISKPYLSEIERGTRNPPSDLIIDQLASVLGIDSFLLYFHAGRLPPAIKSMQVSDEKAVEEFRLFYERLDNARKIKNRVDR